MAHSEGGSSEGSHLPAQEQEVTGAGAGIRDVSEQLAGGDHIWDQIIHYVGQPTTCQKDPGGRLLHDPPHRNLFNGACVPEVYVRQ